MDRWVEAAESRDQLVIFPRRLDEAVPPDHLVRVVVEILERLDWSCWEAAYQPHAGRPAFHPRIMAGVLLYGMLTRIRSSRALEEALQVRLDFRWLAEGRSIDHTTISEFRRRHGEPLKEAFVQLVTLAVHSGIASLKRLGFDGTRIKANNRRSGTRTPEELRRLQQALADEYEKLAAQAEAEDQADDARYGATGNATRLPPELIDVRRRQRQIAAALAELERLEKAKEPLPNRIPLTDPDARVMPNKEGGFAVNYTPVAAMDIDSGIILTTDVVPLATDEQQLVPALDAVQSQFNATPEAVLADGAFGTGANLAELEQRGVTLYSPLRGEARENSALRDDPTQPVPEVQWDRLPMKTVNSHHGHKQRQLEKLAFVYDEPRDCYWCPAGQSLTPAQKTSEMRGGTRIKRVRYRADSAACASCGLRSRCLQKTAKAREISRDQFDGHRERLRKRMATSDGRAIYAQRRHPVERPFAVIKQQFDARQFLMRGLERVRIEWRWLAMAFNVKQLLRSWPTRAGPLLAAA